MRTLKYCTFVVIVTGLFFQAQARDYMNMTPKIVRESEIQSGATNVEAAQNNEQIIKILLGADDTAGQFSMFSDVFTQKDSLVPLHQHNWHDEAFYIVSGRFEVILGSEDKKEVAESGTTIFVPRGTLHGFKSLEENSKVLIVYTPGGWEHYYYESIKLTPEQREDKDFMKQFKESYDSYDPQH
jgi:quercetin dioxygenase-like cupin family protein